MVDDAALCIEKRLDWELEGVKVGLVLARKETEGAWYLGSWNMSLAAREGVVPYGCALLKLYAGSM
jgi:hypothetical protein